MANATMGVPRDLLAYVVRVGTREPEVLRRLRAETAVLAVHDMQIAPEQGALMALLAQAIGARRCLEVGTFTGYSSLAVAMALPSDGEMVCCDVSTEWTNVARRYWAEAGVADRVTLRIGPAVETLEIMISEGGSGTFDFAFIDADKQNYPRYYEQCLQLLRRGGLLLLDNTLWSGEVADPATDDPTARMFQALNESIAADDRVSLSLLPLADGLTLLYKRP